MSAATARAAARPAMRTVALLAGRGIDLVRGHGSTLIDSEGREYVDLVSNYGVNLLGHTHPAVTAAIAHQSALLTNAHLSFGSPVRDDFLTVLGTLLPDQLSRVCFVNSGSESVEVAIKLARAATGRTRIVAMHGGYHGRTYGALSLTAQPAYRDPFAPLLPDVSHVAYDNIEALDAALDERVAAVVIEPIQGESGVRVPAGGYLRAVSAARRWARCSSPTRCRPGSVLARCWPAAMTAWCPTCSASARASPTVCPWP
jgi:[amino-group carrier protein]-gamma-(L-lysyl/L-ornithyl)-L-glutamate aminotransferase